MAKVVEIAVSATSLQADGRRCPVVSLPKQLQA
jgi:hypothetical protein